MIKNLNNIIKYVIRTMNLRAKIFRTSEKITRIINEKDKELSIIYTDDGSAVQFLLGTNVRLAIPYSAASGFILLCFKSEIGSH